MKKRTATVEKPAVMVLRRRADIKSWVEIGERMPPFDLAGFFLNFVAHMFDVSSDAANSVAGREQSRGDSGQREQGKGSF